MVVLICFCKTPPSSWLKLILKFAKKTSLARYINNFQVQFTFSWSPHPLLCNILFLICMTLKIRLLCTWFIVPFCCVKNLCKVLSGCEWFWVIFTGVRWFGVVVPVFGCFCWFCLVVCSFGWFGLILGGSVWFGVVLAGF